MREPVRQLISRLLPVVRRGGAVPLSAIAEATVGDRLDPKLREALDARKKVTFQPTGKTARFENVGPEVSVRLKRFTLKVPGHLRGRAQMLDDGVELRFDRANALSACKLFFCVKLERLEVTRHRVLVDLEGDSLDQCFVLD